MSYSNLDRDAHLNELKKKPDVEQILPPMRLSAYQRTYFNISRTPNPKIKSMRLAIRDAKGFDKKSYIWDRSKNEADGTENIEPSHKVNKCLIIPKIL